MRSITDVAGCDSGIAPEYRAVQRLDVEGPIAVEGAAGETYDLVAVNGAAPTSRQRLTLLAGDGPGGPAAALARLQGIQRKILRENHLRHERGETPVHAMPALRALPRFTFQGRMRGRAVFGRAAEPLDAEGYVPLSSLTDGRGSPHLAKRYDAELSVPDRLLLAQDLAEGLQALRSLPCVLGRLAPRDVLVDPGECRLAIAGFTAAAVPDGPAGSHTLALAPGGDTAWMAPEMLEGVAVHGHGSTLVDAGPATDDWALTLAIHRLLLRCDPWFILRDRTPATIREYLARGLWPLYDGRDALFTPGMDERHAEYVDRLGELPPPVFGRLLAALNGGAGAPSRRPSPADWTAELAAQRERPRIVHFAVTPERIVQGQPVTLSWRVSGARGVGIEPGIGPVEAVGSRELRPEHDTVFALSVTSRRGGPLRETVDVRVTRAPVMQTLVVPAPGLSQRLVVQGLRFAAPAVEIGAPRIRLGAPVLPSAPAPDLSFQPARALTRPPPAVPAAPPQATATTPAATRAVGRLFTRLRERVKAELTTRGVNP